MKDTKSAAAWSFVATYCLLAAIAWYTDGFALVISDLKLFFSGEALSIAVLTGDYIKLLSYTAASIVIDLPMVALAAFVSYLLDGNHTGEHGVSSLLNLKEEAPLFKRLFKLVVLEELYARGLFLGILLSIAPQNAILLYLLFLIGNGTWALVHLSNFKKQSDRKVSRVLPQFVSGIFFTLIFLKFGLIGAIFSHFAFNALLFAFIKCKTQIMLTF